MFTEEFAYPVSRRRWSGLDRIAAQVALDVIREPAGRFISPRTIFLDRFHDDPVKVSAQNLF